MYTVHPPIQAALPERVKISEGVKHALWNARQLNGSSELTPDWLQELVHFPSEDGEMARIVLSIDRPAFTTVMKAFCR